MSPMPSETRASADRLRLSGTPSCVAIASMSDLAASASRVAIDLRSQILGMAMVPGIKLTDNTKSTDDNQQRRSRLQTENRHRTDYPLSVITKFTAHFAAEDPIRPGGVHQDDRQEKQRADQEKRLRAWRRGRLPQRVMIGHDHRPQADANAEERHHKQRDGAEKWCQFISARERVPFPDRDCRSDDRNGRKQEDIRPAKPAARDIGIGEWGPDADREDADQDCDQAETARAACPFLQITFCLKHKPSRAEKPVARNQGQTGEQRERRCKIERGSGKVASINLKTLNEAAQNHPLSKRGDNRAAAERAIPEATESRVLKSKFKSNPTENERQ